MYALVAVLFYNMINGSYPAKTCIGLSNQVDQNESVMFLKKKPSWIKTFCMKEKVWTIVRQIALALQSWYALLECSGTSKKKKQYFTCLWPYSVL